MGCRVFGEEEQEQEEEERQLPERLIRGGKRVLVVVNKVDILREDERASVVEFVRGKTAELLGGDVVEVVGVSSREVLRAKITSGRDGAGGDPRAGAGAKGLTRRSGVLSGRVPRSQLQRQAAELQRRPLP
ncbi:hypothetical protein TrRE_jg9035 [Triparma retinervis]|uniref:Uncharacterized protein n=1 Tax=Triparma retinervis TaxID=2557542 RepID=A0A9W7DL19_9STRA|nr:hypothetical protein TrRE_jg9035 [Triparma retinervis]